MSLPGAISTPPACMPTLRVRPSSFSARVQQLSQLLFALDALVELRLRLARLLQRDAEFVGDQLGELVDEVEAEVEHAADVADHRLGRHGAEGGDLRHGVGAVLVLARNR